MHPKSTDILTGGTPMPPLGEDQIMEAIASGDQAAADIARQAGMSILELAEHVCTAQNLETLARVKQLHATHREVLLGKLKRNALVRLAELTDEVPVGSADEVRAFEVMRKACVDLLRSGGLHTEKRPSSPEGPGGSGGSRSRGYHLDSITPAFEAEVLEAFERLGEEVNEYEPRTYSETQGPPSCPPWRGRMNGSVEHPSSKMKSSFISPPGEGPRPGGQARLGGQAGANGGYASGSLSKCTGKPSGPPRRMPMPPESTPPRIVLMETSETRTGGTPMPLYRRSTPNRISNTYNRIPADDAHPP